MKPATHRKPAKKGRGKRVNKKESTKRAILRAALKLFVEKGFYRTTTKSVSSKAGIAEGTLFNYFPTKEDLALYFFEQELDAVIDLYKQDDRIQRATLPEKLFAIIQQSLDRLSPYEEFIGAALLRGLAPASKLSPWNLQSQERHLRYLRFIRDILAQAEVAGEIPHLGDIGAYAFGLFHLAMGMHRFRDTSKGKEETLALMDRCLKVAAHLLKGGWEW
jgi:AcrR family transcriptional regulator